MSADAHVVEAEQALLEVELARTLHRGGEARAAMARVLVAAEQAVALDPDHPAAQRLRALALLELGRPREAVKASLAAVRTAPTAADPHALLARALAETGNVHGAIAAAGEAVRLDPAAASGWYAQGLLAFRGGQWEVAEGNCRKVLELEPDHLGALQLLDATIQRRIGPTEPAGRASWAGPGVRRVLPWWRTSVTIAVVFLATAFLLSAVLR